MHCHRLLAVWFWRLLKLHFDSNLKTVQRLPNQCILQQLHNQCICHRLLKLDSSLKMYKEWKISPVQSVSLSQSAETWFPQHGLKTEHSFSDLNFLWWNSPFHPCCIRVCMTRKLVTLNCITCVKSTRCRNSRQSPLPLEDKSGSFILLTDKRMQCGMWMCINAGRFTDWRRRWKSP